MDTPRPKIAETIIHETVRLREAVIGRRCEVLRNSIVEYATLGGYSYLGENCDLAGAVIGKFTAIANSVRIGAPNHPMSRPSQHRFTVVARLDRTTQYAAAYRLNRCGLWNTGSPGRALRYAHISGGALAMRSIL